MRIANAMKIDIASFEKAGQFQILNIER